MESLTQQLLHQQNECTLAWIKADGSPASTVVSFVYLDEKLWMTALEGSGRVKAIRQEPRVCVSISGKGTELGHSRCVSIQGRCDVLSDSTHRNYFFPAFAKVVLPDSERGALMMAQMMNSPENLVLILNPTKIIPYDAHDMLEQANKA